MSNVSPQKARQQRLAAEGLCVQCGKAPPKEGIKRCEACIARQTQYNKARLAKLETQEVIAAITPSVPSAPLVAFQAPKPRLKETAEYGSDSPFAGLSKDEIAQMMNGGIEI